MKQKSFPVKRTACAVLASLLLMGAPLWSHFGSAADEPGLLLTASAEEKQTIKINKASPRWIAEFGNLKMYKPDTPINAKKILSDLKYETLHFAGSYCVNGLDIKDAEAVKAFYEAHTSRITIDKTSYCAVPVEYFLNSRELKSDTNFIRLAGEDGTVRSFSGKLEYNKGTLSVALRSSKAEGMNTIDYKAETVGGEVTLSFDGDKVTLISDWMDTTKEKSLSCSSLKPAALKKLDNIAEITIVNRYYRRNTYYGGTYVNLVLDDKTKVYNACAYWNENGVFNLSWTDYDGTVHAYELVAFICDNSICLTDGNKTYQYSK